MEHEVFEMATLCLSIRDCYRDVINFPPYRTRLLDNDDNSNTQSRYRMLSLVEIESRDLQYIASDHFSKISDNTIARYQYL